MSFHKKFLDLYIIDTVQNGKKTFINSMVKQKEMQECINNYIDAETNFAKTFVNILQNHNTNYFKNVDIPSFFKSMV